MSNLDTSETLMSLTQSLNVSEKTHVWVAILLTHCTQSGDKLDMRVCCVQNVLITIMIDMRETAALHAESDQG